MGADIEYGAGWAIDRDPDPAGIRGIAGHTVDRRCLKPGGGIFTVLLLQGALTLLQRWRFGGTFSVGTVVGQEGCSRIYGYVVVGGGR
jgi:hypothetical protein